MLAIASANRTPAEALRFTAAWASEQAWLADAATPVVKWLRPFVERDAPAAAIATLGKGATPGNAGRTPPRAPAPRAEARAAMPPQGGRYLVRTGDDLAAAIRAATAGTEIVLAPGIYRLTRKVETAAGGNGDRPIRVHAPTFGDAIIEVAAEEGIRVARPHWIFENLAFKGVCSDDNTCEHALHVVGVAQGVRVSNNSFSDFNAAIKINGEDGAWPDGGTIERNTFRNHRPRQTTRSVAAIDLVGASRWVVVDNLFTDISKDLGSRISYAMFMKGGGTGGRIERNVILCASARTGGHGQRIGISLGGGGTESGHCRDGRCTTEHSEAIVANNVVAHCNDFGIDVHKATRITVGFNTLVNTEGIDLRGHPTSAEVYGNILDGRLRARDDAWLTVRDNIVGKLDRLFDAPEKLNLRWRAKPEHVARGEGVAADFCARPRDAATPQGAIPSGEPCL
ncbi:MAG: right-handed parallel beta-helix repeat-containing protein [Burkholderiales bacterium]|nr:right-handed parallel beta-helix repeat-containing protein [Burkholderiales bacterium]